ncbi:MAG TPA: hypothetical protein VF006_23770 [Longimicrobium sp.]
MRTLFAAALVTAGCSAPAPEPPRDTRDTPPMEISAYIAHPGAAPEVAAPSAARAGEPLTVQVTTYGNGCNTAGRDEVRTRGLEADVLPRDLDHSRELIDCPDLLRVFRHTATVRFDQPGAATVRVHGRRLPGGEPVVVTRSVTITAP